MWSLTSVGESLLSRMRHPHPPSAPSALKIAWVVEINCVSMRSKALPLSFSAAPSHREPFSPSAFQLGEKVPKADEGEVLAGYEAFTVCANYACVKRLPHPPIGTFSPRKKPRGEKGSRLESAESWKVLTSYLRARRSAAGRRTLPRAF